MATEKNLMPFEGSNFRPFSIKLDDDAVLTGISCIPPSITPNPLVEPLIVAIHGGACTALNYDIDSKHTASISAHAYGVPFVAINRPDYGSTTSLRPYTNYHKDIGAWLHQKALPNLWKNFGTGLEGIVLDAHSMAVPMAIIAAGMHGSDNDAAYPLIGLILSGFGVRLNEVAKANTILPPMETMPLMVEIPRPAKEVLMLSDPNLGLCQPEMYDKVWNQNVGMPREESYSGVQWGQDPGIHGPDCAGVKVPVYFAFGEYDHPWEASEVHLHELKALLKNCPEFVGEVVKNAPHAIEWSKVGQDYYSKCFSWAVKAAIRHNEDLQKHRNSCPHPS